MCNAFNYSGSIIESYPVLVELVSGIKEHTFRLPERNMKYSLPKGDFYQMSFRVPLCVENGDCPGSGLCGSFAGAVFHLSDVLAFTHMLGMSSRDVTDV